MLWSDFPCKYSRVLLSIAALVTRHSEAGRGAKHKMMMVRIHYCLFALLFLATSMGHSQTVTALLAHTFTNPYPAAFSSFGNAVAVIGTDKVLIASLLDTNVETNKGGAVHLFRTDGTLVTTFTNPIPAM